MAELDSALGKGLRVLEALAEAGGPVRLSTLAAQLDLQKSAVHRILQTLADAGFAAQDADTGLYRATLKVWELGTGVASALPVKQAAAAVIQELHRRTSETVSLTVLDGDDVLYLDKLLAARPIGFTTRVGSRVPAPLTAGGRALLAYEDPAEAEAIVDRVLARRGPEAFDRKKALADIRRARKDGYVVGRGRSERGIVGIAAAVPGANGRAVAGLTVSAPQQRLDDDRQRDIIEALLEAAARLGEVIGRT
jgi:DNA-binding IclR family transcriptional regulator